MRLLRPITGLVFAIDFRHNGKDAWYRTAGSLAGTLAGTATIVNGALDCDADDEKLTFAIGAAAQVPGIAGAVLADVTHDAGNRSEQECMFSARPATGANGNSLDLFRATGANAGKPTFLVYDSAAAATTQIGGTAYNSAGRRNWCGYWEGFGGGAGTGVVGVTVDGAAPTETTGITATRTEVAATGAIVLGARDANGVRWMAGQMHRFAIFNITNPAGQDLTAAGWSASAIWDAIFPRTRGGAFST